MAVEPLHTRDAAAAGRLLAASHRDYPAFRALLPDPGVRARVLPPFRTAAARDTARYGTGLVVRATDTPDGLAGVALWMAPGQFPLGAARKARMTPGLTRAAFAAAATVGEMAVSGVRLGDHYTDSPVSHGQAGV